MKTTSAPYKKYIYYPFPQDFFQAVVLINCNPLFLHRLVWHAGDGRRKKNVDLTSPLFYFFLIL